MKKNTLSLIPGWCLAAAALSLIPMTGACKKSEVQKEDQIEAKEAKSAPGLRAAAGHVTVKSALARAASAAEDSESVRAVTRGQREFSADLFRKLSGEFSGKNAAISAFSIHQVLGMAWTGAAGETASQMAAAMHFGADTSAGQNSLAQILKGRKADDVMVRVSNAFWSSIGRKWKRGWLDTLAQYYGTGVETLNFAGAPAESRNFINDWVARETDDRVRDLLPPGSITDQTTSILTNAVYFKAPWDSPFKKENTRNAEFHLAAGGTVQVPFVINDGDYIMYAAGDGWQAAQKTFRGGKLAMLFILPAEGDGNFDALSKAMDAEKFDAIVGSLKPMVIALHLPKFKFTTAVSLSTHLADMGMKAPFDASAADFTGMTEEKPLWIDEIYHKTFVALDEKEVEAAAASGAAAANSLDYKSETKFFADRPFFFAIRDIPSGAVLFFGQLMDPSQK